MNPENTPGVGAPGAYQPPTPVAGNPAVGTPGVPGPYPAVAGYPGGQAMLHHANPPTGAHQVPGGNPAHAVPQATAQQTTGQAPQSANPGAQGAPHQSGLQHAAAVAQHAAAAAAQRLHPHAGAVDGQPAQTGAQPTGAQPVRTSIRSGSHETGTSAGGDASGEEERKGILKGLGGLIRRRENADEEKALKAATGPRRVRAMVTTVDPWSVMKLAFLLAIAAGVVLVIAVSIVWNVLNKMGVFIEINTQVDDLFGPETGANIKQFLEQDKILSAAILLACVNAVLMTGLATIGAILYNLIVKLVGGVYVTLSDE